MPNSSTLTVRRPMRPRLNSPPLPAKRTCNFLAAEAIAAYVERELAIVEAVERGRADVRAGRTTPHEEVAHDARGIIKAPS